MPSSRTPSSIFGYTHSVDWSKLQVRKCSDGGGSLILPYSLRFLTHLTECNPGVLLSGEPQKLLTDGCGLQMVSSCKRSIRIMLVGIHYRPPSMLKELSPTGRTILLATIFLCPRLHVISKSTT